MMNMTMLITRVNAMKMGDDDNKMCYYCCYFTYAYISFLPNDCWRRETLYNSMEN